MAGPQNAFNKGKGWKPKKPGLGAGWGTAVPANPGLVAGAAAQAGPNVTPGANGQWAPTSDVGGPPIDPQYEAYKLSANRNLAVGNANATYQTGVAEQTYGYGASGAANPYSRAALLQEQFQRSQRGTLNSMGAQHLYGGAYGRAQGENQHQYSIAEDANRRAYDQSIYGINYGKAQNAATYGAGMDDAAFNALIKALGGGQ